MVRVSIICMTLFISAVLSIFSVATCEAKPSPLEKLDRVNLADLLDAPLDEEFLTRGLQESTMAPTPATGAASTSSPSVAPTPSPVYDVRGLETMTPTSFDTAAPTETSDGMGSFPAAASMAITAMVVVVTALTA